MTNATIYMNLTKADAGESICFGCRFEGQFLPKHSVVIGFMKLVGDEVVELIDEPSFKPNQEASYQDALAYARATLLEDYEDDSLGDFSL